MTGVAKAFLFTVISQLSLFGKLESVLCNPDNLMRPPGKRSIAGKWKFTFPQ